MSIYINSYTLFSSFILYISVSVLDSVLFFESVSVPFVPYLLRWPVLSKSYSWLTSSSESQVVSHRILKVRSRHAFQFDTSLNLARCFTVDQEGTLSAERIRTRPRPVIIPYSCHPRRKPSMSFISPVFPHSECQSCAPQS